MALFGPPNVDKMKEKKDVQGLVKALGYEKDNGIRESAARALGEIGDKRAVEALIDVLNDRDWEKRRENKPVRCAAAIALGHIGDLRAVRPLAETLDDYKMEVDRPAKDALIEIGAPSVVDEVMAVINDLMNLKNDAYAFEVLSSLGKTAVEPLIPYLEHEVKNVRYAAVISLGNIGDPRAVEPLIKVLRDSVEHIRSRAARALGQIGDTRAVEALTLALEDSWSDMRRAGAEALGNIGDPLAVYPLVNALKKDPKEKAYAAALAKIDTQEAREALLALRS